MTELVTGQDFRGFVRGYQHTAFRLEVRDRYNEPGEAEPLRQFLAGESIGDWYEDWEDLQRRWAAEGKRMTRVRVVTEPHTDYARFGLLLAGLSAAAGEDIRYLPRDQAKEVKAGQELTVRCRFGPRTEPDGNLLLSNTTLVKAQ